MIRSKVLIVIPTRLTSTRLPGKPMLDVGNGRSLIEQCYKSVLSATLLISTWDFRVVIATDCTELTHHCNSFAPLADVVQVDGDLASGTERVARLCQLEHFKAYSKVLVVQGDEISTPDTLIKLMCLASDLLPPDRPPFRTPVITAVTSKHNNKKKSSDVFVFQDPEHNAISFERGDKLSNLAKSLHLGYNLFTQSQLRFYLDTPPGGEEVKRSIELMRFVQAGYPVFVVDTPPVPSMMSVNTAEDLEEVRNQLGRHI